MSKRQSIVAQSTAEAEYVAACGAAIEAKAQFNILSEIFPSMHVRPVIGIDNSAAHVMATSPTYSRRTRHIELRWHFVRDQVQRGLIKLVKVKGENNPADAFTKPLDKVRLDKLCGMTGMMN
ncbi:FOG: Transposon-encoded proteins with TYA, reverse transcriptase, integrase domains in various combinations [Plasmopara halstedii]|uniref:FOG: Transposon-encoded proteins with TYA, reverse transcriptase, integrase domains in various combinations n=1 Tax=Plasmopara halstedii TaxID=4781 RepID=A0A0P1B4U2_PLAHL|nr:FOG: Transposon-encoded proteins with TYA, reverse transcriptase, integrase domains in various combinations [Plasmopara halstedii]CEG48738.1 FOG: Transposon-encoded proteins with TYA, reverse transcriptase, integrase domains in various combinations [Plasmopara halstedii]|eukprot:XP_024585107.1 FOG: Transposon-encoded proteins with TYA, reverse transcriptase, integrase domains in various combinations [Plasmopara halstedii]